ncbi:hypothetical protein [Janibacter sp. GXQ6167]|uniref:AtpZ/AtpI family protein n=1 Tax=Janibacter sp. GXQ6167 TaxID=3240791 RepID=UPI00352486FC
MIGRRSPKGEQPRLVTKAPGRAKDAHRWATESDGPSLTAQSDSMGATVLAHLITGPALFGGIGYALDRWLNITGLVVVGILLGMGLSLYSIWLRYGTTVTPSERGATPTPSDVTPRNEENT